MSKKKISLIYLACGALLWLIMREFFSTVWVWLEWSFGSDWLVPIYDVLGILFALGLFIFLLLNQKVNTYVVDVISELSKVVWPDRKETMMSTGVVAVLIAICSMLLFGFDVLWGYLVSLFYQ